jgi:glyceraldehyde 3-phosphate dehydrogenase
MTERTDKIKVGINGFGRIGRLVFRAAVQRFDAEVEICAINDPMLTPEYMAYLIKHDSVFHNPGFMVDEVKSGQIVVNGKAISTFASKDASELQWGRSGVEIVAECSGFYTSSEKAKGHLEADGAQKVILSAPAKDEVTPTFVMGVNEADYDPSMRIVSNASCTTNCLAPLIKIIHENFGVEEALMTTIHALTASQNVVDGVSKKDWRAGRSALNNIIPASTGAARAISSVIPALSGKLTGMAFRVPVSDVSVLDLTCRLQQPVQSIDTITEAIRRAEGTLGRVVGVTTEPVVSSDFIGDDRSCIFDAAASIVLNPHFVKLIAYYDNEWAYALRLVSIFKYQLY